MAALFFFLAFGILEPCPALVAWILTSTSAPPHPPPSLQSSVRNEVMATSHVTDEWMTLMEMSSLNCYIVRRYIATPSGVLRIYPGSLMDKAFDPTRRQW